MNDPHVVALNYKIEHHSSVDYDKASPLVHSEDAFEICVESDNVRFVMKTHYATTSEALAAVADYIHAWEHLAALQYGPHQFNLVFDRPEIEDRDPTPGDVHAIANTAYERISIIDQATAHLSRGEYPRPPTRKMNFSGEAELMFQRYVRYRARREYLTGMANFCLTVLEGSVQNDQGRRKAAARRYDIEYKILDEIGRLCSQKGGAEARKAQGIDQDLNGPEQAFLEEATKAIILRTAEVAADPDGARDTIALSDFPDCQQSPQ